MHIGNETATTLCLKLWPGSEGNMRMKLFQVSAASLIARCGHLYVDGAKGSIEKYFKAIFGQIFKAKHTFCAGCKRPLTMVGLFRFVRQKGVVAQAYAYET